MDSDNADRSTPGRAPDASGRRFRSMRCAVPPRRVIAPPCRIARNCCDQSGIAAARRAIWADPTLLAERSTRDAAALRPLHRSLAIAIARFGFRRKCNPSPPFGNATAVKPAAKRERPPGPTARSRPAAARLQHTARAGRLSLAASCATWRTASGRGRIFLLRQHLSSTERRKR